MVVAIDPVQRRTSYAYDRLDRPTVDWLIRAADASVPPRVTTGGAMLDDVEEGVPT